MRSPKPSCFASSTSRARGNLFRPSLELLEDRTLLAAIPILHSRPSAPASLYLDFNGETVGGTTYLPYDTDGNPNDFNATEVAAITECWRHLSIYFSMFNVDVTTEKDSRPMAWHLSSNSISGGYSYVGVFPNDQPLSFNQSGDVTGRQSGIAHEFGHNLGLWHISDYDQWGVKSAEYSSGFDNLHGPIMGVDYAQRVHKWFIGHYTNSGTLLQDDLAIISSSIAAAVGGDGFAPDDHAGTFAGATVLPTVSGIQTASGVIERMNDIDAFRFTHTGGTAVIDVYPNVPSGLDAKLELYDAAGVFITAVDPNGMNDQHITLNLAAGDYYALVSSHGDYGDVGTYDISVRKLANQWAKADIGSVGYGGTSGYNATTGEYTVAGGGADIWGTADAFHYNYLRLDGDGRIVAQVTQNQNTNAWAKVGVMMRETLAANSKHVSMFTTRGNGLQMSWRTAAGGSTSGYNPNTGQAFVPRWVALQRTGDVFTASWSNDGITWTQFQQTTVPMGQTVYVGLASGAVNNNALNYGVFKNAKLYGRILAGDPAPGNNGLTPPTNVTPALGIGSNVVLSWNAVTGATGYAIDRSDGNGYWTQIGTTASTSYTATGLFGSMRHFFRVRATNASGTSLPSAQVSIVNRPNAPTNLTVASWTRTQLILNWRDVSGDTGYRIERSTDGVNFTTVGTVGTNIPSWTDSGLTANTQYWYRLAALSPQGDSLYSTVVSRFTRLVDVTGLAFTSLTSSSASFQWNAVAGAADYLVERSTDGSTFTTLSTVAGTSYTDNTVSSLQAYYYRVTGQNTTNNTKSQNSATIFGATPATSPLPNPWQQTDIGGVGGPGAAGESSGTFTVWGSGADIWNTADQFRYVYQSWTGDGTITARVVSQLNTSGWAKAGVMFRETLAAGSKQAMTIVSPSNGTAFQRRDTTGGSSTHTGGSGVAPYWVRIRRVGNTFTSYVSSNGTAWTTIGSQTIAMGATIYVGLAVTATNNSRLTKAVFDNVVVTSSTSFGGGIGPGGAAGYGGGLGGLGGLLFRARPGHRSGDRLAASASHTHAAGGAHRRHETAVDRLLASTPIRRAARRGAASPTFSAESHPAPAGVENDFCHQLDPNDPNGQLHLHGGPGSGHGHDLNDTGHH